MRKYCFLFLMVCVLGCFSGCGQTNQEKPGFGTGTNMGEYVYVPEFQNIGEAYEPNFFDSFGFDIREGELIYAIRQYSLDEPIHMHKTNLHTGKTEDVAIEYKRNPQMDNYAVGQAGFDGENRLHMIYKLVPVISEGTDASTQYEYRIYGENGGLEKNFDITEHIVVDNKSAEITACHVTKSGEVFCVLENDDKAEVIVLSGDELLARIDLENKRLLDMGPNYKNGCLLLLQTAGSDTLEIGLIDTSMATLKILFSKISRDVIGIIGADDKELLLNTEEVLYRYDISKKITEELLNWKDYDVRGEQVCFGQMTDKENLYFALSNGMYFAETLHLSLVPRAEVPKNELIVLATPTDIEGSMLAKMVASYNKYNGKYVIEPVQMKYENGEFFLDGKGFDQVILGEQCPDLVPLNQSLNVEKFALSGAFEDLSQYLNKSQKLQREDLQESILRAYTCGDRLLCIPSAFSFTNVLVGKQSLLGTESLNHISDLQALSLQNKEKKLFAKISRTELLNMGWKSFVDFEAGESNFDSAEFISFLKWLNTYSDELKTEPIDLKGYQDGRFLFREIWFDNVRECLVNVSLFGEKIFLQGYPGWGGASISATEALAIPTNSKQKEGAWDFIEYCLRYKKVNPLYSDFPTRKDMLQELFALAMRDTSNDKYYMEGVEIPISPATQEEINMLQDLIDRGLVAKEISKAWEKDIYNIILEEIDGYFSGQKSAEEVAKIIQSRVRIYLLERK